MISQRIAGCGVYSKPMWHRRPLFCTVRSTAYGRRVLHIYKIHGMYDNLEIALTTNDVSLVGTSIHIHLSMWPMAEPNMSTSIEWTLRCKRNNAIWRRWGQYKRRARLRIALESYARTQMDDVMAWPSLSLAVRVSHFYHFFLYLLLFDSRQSRILG